MNKKYKEYGSRTRPYRIWCSMKQRCYYNKSVGFKNYEDAIEDAIKYCLKNLIS